LQDITKYPLMSTSQEPELAQRKQSNDKKPPYGANTAESNLSSVLRNIICKNDWTSLQGASLAVMAVVLKDLECIKHLITTQKKPCWTVLQRLFQPGGPDLLKNAGSPVSMEDVNLEIFTCGKCHQVTRMKLDDKVFSAPGDKEEWVEFCACINEEELLKMHEEKMKEQRNQEILRMQMLQQKRERTQHDVISSDEDAVQDMSDREEPIVLEWWDQETGTAAPEEDEDYDYVSYDMVDSRTKQEKIVPSSLSADEKFAVETKLTHQQVGQVITRMRRLLEQFPDEDVYQLNGSKIEVDAAWFLKYLIFEEDASRQLLSSTSSKKPVFKVQDKKTSTTRKRKGATSGNAGPRKKQAGRSIAGGKDRPGAAGGKEVMQSKDFSIPSNLMKVLQTSGNVATIFWSSLKSELDLGDEHVQHLKDHNLLTLPLNTYNDAQRFVEDYVVPRAV